MFNFKVCAPVINKKVGVSLDHYLPKPCTRTANRHLYGRGELKGEQR